MAHETGFLFATTGKIHGISARKAARALREVMPRAQIDWFTDQDTTDPVFDQTHALSHQGRRPKMEAMRRSRFKRSVYLDADTLVLTDVSDLFETLDHWDIAGAHGVDRGPHMCPAQDDVPRAMPVINTGVLAVKSSAKVRAFMAEWEAEMNRRRDTLDQPSFRQLLYRSPLRFLALPYEYNMKERRRLDFWRPALGAPRILHESQVTQGDMGDMGDPMTPYVIEDFVGPERANHIRALLSEDFDLGGAGNKLVLPYQTHHRAREARIQSLHRELEETRAKIEMLKAHVV